jgi:acyl dehydratase
MALSTDIVGMTYTHPEPYEVGKEKVREYAAAVKNEDDAYFDDGAASDLGHDGVLASLTFTSIFGFRAQMAFFAHANIPIEGEQFVQTEQRLKFVRPIKAGDTLYLHLSIDSLRRAFGADVLVLGSRITNQAGETVQEGSTTLAGRSEPTDGTASVPMTA